MESASASTNGPVATAGVSSTAESGHGVLVKPPPPPAAAGAGAGANRDQLEQDTDSSVVKTLELPGYGAPVDGEVVDAIDSSVVNAADMEQKEEVASSNVNAEAKDTKSSSSSADVATATSDSVIETGDNDTNNSHEEEEEKEEDPDYDGMIEELTEEEEKSAMLNIVLSELLRKFREENGRGPSSLEVLDIRASIAEQLEMEVTTSESLEQFNSAHASAATRPRETQQDREGDDRKRPAEASGSQQDDSSSQPAPKRVKFHSSVASSPQADDFNVDGQRSSQQQQEAPS